MRVVAAAAALALAACSSTPAGTGKLTLNDPFWDRVNVEVVITKAGDCDSRGKGLVSRREFIMMKNSPESFVVPDGANLCWRHDPNPNKPVAGLWSGWTKATLMPGQSAETDL